jgi:hypothetical protein
MVVAFLGHDPDSHELGSAMSVETRTAEGSWLPLGTLAVTTTVIRL